MNNPASRDLLKERTLRIRAPAKLNLGLRIGRRRDDGFHSIDTIFQTISIFDNLSLTFDPSLSRDELEIVGPESFPPERSNLVLQALRKLRSAGHDIPYAQVKLEKQIPLGSGMGGGSSNAAAILHSACLLENLEPNNSSIERLAVELGADVPFFLQGGTARGQGIGEKLDSLADLEGYVLAVVPPISVDTAWAYSHFDEFLPDDREEFEPLISTGDSQNSHAWKQWSLENDFLPLLEESYDCYQTLLPVLRNLSESVSLSGSGSTLYALFDNQGDAVAGEKSVRDQVSRDVLTFQAEFLGSDQIPCFVEMD